MTGEPTDGTLCNDGFAAFTDDVLNEMMEATVKMAERAIFLSMVCSLCFLVR